MCCVSLLAERRAAFVSFKFPRRDAYFVHVQEPRKHNIRATSQARRPQLLVIRGDHTLPLPQLPAIVLNGTL